MEKMDKRIMEVARNAMKEYLERLYNTYWAQFMVEAFQYNSEKIQIAKFYPSVQFLDPFISGPNYVGGLNTLYNEGFYWDDLMNQTTGSNQNVNNQFVIAGGWGQPEMTWENSNYDLKT